MNILSAIKKWWIGTGHEQDFHAAGLMGTRLGREVVRASMYPPPGDDPIMTDPRFKIVDGVTVPASSISAYNVTNLSEYRLDTAPGLPDGMNTITASCIPYHINDWYHDIETTAMGTLVYDAMGAEVANSRMLVVGQAHTVLSLLRELRKLDGTLIINGYRLDPTTMTVHKQEEST